MKTYTEKRFFEWHEDEVAVSIRAASGSYGGERSVYCSDTCGPLQATDYKGPRSQYVEEGKLVVIAVDMGGQIILRSAGGHSSDPDMHPLRRAGSGLRGEAK